MTSVGFIFVDYSSQAWLGVSKRKHRQQPIPIVLPCPVVLKCLRKMSVLSIVRYEAACIEREIVELPFSAAMARSGGFRRLLPALLFGKEM